MFVRLLKPLLVCLVTLLVAPFSWSAIQFDQAALQTWADNFFQPRVDAGIFNGASVGVVQNGQTVFLKGYGYEDLGRKVPLDPNATMIRMCSVSKTFTATAILQLRDRGLIQSLDDPANKYLKRYQLPPPYGDDVTIRQLMTHSSGMAGHFTPQGTKLDIPVPVSEDIVAEMFQENIERPPGTVGQYANLGVALESVIIEDVSGQSMSDYVAEHIIVPLGMTDTIMHHDTSVPPRLAQPYGRFANGELQAVGFYPKHPLTAASGGIIAPPRDMMRYVAMHADISASANAKVLSAASRQEMQQVQFRNHPSEAGIGLHFYPENFGGHRYVSHGCGLPGTQSQLGVFPDSNAGVVISILRGSTSPSVGDLVGSLFGVGRMVKPEGQEEPVKFENNSPWQAFLQEFVGSRQQPAAVSAPEAMGDAQLILGNYWTERRSMGAFSALFAAGAVLEVKPGSADGLKIGSFETNRVAPGVYDSDTGRRFIFRQPADSPHIYLHAGPSSAWRKVDGLSDPGLVSTLMTIGFLISLSALASPWWPRANQAAVWIRRNGLVMAGLFILMPLVALVGYESVGDIAYIDAFNGDTTRLIFLVVLLNLFGLSGAGFVLSAVAVWMTSATPGWRALLWRCHVSLLGIAALLTWPGYVLFNMIGVNR